jgi:hypothetical protein
MQPTWYLAKTELHRWLRTKSTWCGDGISPPTDELVRSAIELADRLRSAGYHPPTFILPDGDGGVVFEFRYDPSYTRIVLNPDRTIERLAFEHGMLKLKDSLQITLGA